MRVHRATDKILPAESSKQAKSHKTHGARRHSETACARAHLVETRSPWDQHTLARDAPLDPNPLPHYHSSKVLSQTSAVGLMRGPNPPFIRTASILDFTLGEWRPCPSVNQHGAVSALSTVHARCAHPSRSSLQNFLLKQTRRGLGMVHCSCALHPLRSDH